MPDPNGFRAPAVKVDGPDTEPMRHPSPIPSTRSVNVDVDVNSSTAFASKVAETKASILARKSSDEAEGECSEQPQFATFAGRADESRITGHGKQDYAAADNSTTLQSMRRPELVPGGVPHSRRFLSIERELEQNTAASKLLEKSLKRVQKEVRIAWIVAACATIVSIISLLV